MSATPVDLQEVTNNWHRMSAQRREILLIGGIILVISLLALAWLLVTRKSRQRRSRHHSHHSRQFGMNPDASPSEPALAVPHRRKWRRRRRDHRPRNPTLAETGGLPPIRPDGQHGTSP